MPLLRHTPAPARYGGKAAIRARLQAMAALPPYAPHPAFYLKDCHHDPKIF